MTDLDVAQSLADAAYANQQLLINNSLATDLAAFSGDTTSVGLNAFEWPTLPTPFVLPDAVEDSFSGAPWANFYGPDFDWYHDPIYQSLAAAADGVYSTAADLLFANYRADYDSQNQTRHTAFHNRDLLLAGQMSAAQANYNAAISGANPFAGALATAESTRDSQTQLAESNFQDDLKRGS